MLQTLEVKEGRHYIVSVNRTPYVTRITRVSGQIAYYELVDVMIDEGRPHKETLSMLGARIRQTEEQVEKWMAAAPDSADLVSAYDSGKTGKVIYQHKDGGDRYIIQAGDMGFSRPIYGFDDPYPFDPVGYTEWLLTHYPALNRRFAGFYDAVYIGGQQLPIKSLHIFKSPAEDAPAK